jgi:hypothetical protein
MTLTNDRRPWWEAVTGPELNQGDFLPGCVVPLIPEEFAPSDEKVEEFEGQWFDLIVVTQSCDLENDKVPFVALCPLYSLKEFEKDNPTFKGKWEAVRQGRREGLHMLASTTNPEDNSGALVVDFRQVFSLPVGYLHKRATNAGGRMRLKSPYVEHFSQAFARFFMRVGLPGNIPPFK